VIALTDEFLRTETGVLCTWPTDVDSPVADSWSITAPLAPFSARQVTTDPVARRIIRKAVGARRHQSHAPAPALP
jgi:hypothetical protein